jgi:hypothetical protein
MTSVMGVFDRREALLGAIAAAKAHGFTIVTAFLPAFDSEIVDAASAHRSVVSQWTLGSGILGGSSALVFTIWTVRQWPGLVVGGKPLVALLPFLIIAFELTILFAACAAVVAVVAGDRAIGRMARRAYEQSFSEARFGLLLACPPAQTTAAGKLLQQHGAAAWRVI